MILYFLHGQDDEASTNEMTGWLRELTHVQGEGWDKVQVGWRLNNIELERARSPSGRCHV